MKYKVKELVMTCDECPSQWEAKLEDGRMMYFRYRWGFLDISISEITTDDVMKAVGGTIIYSESHGHSMDGVMNTEELIKLTKHLIKYPKEYRR